MRGYTAQYGESAAAIYAGLQNGTLRWVGLAAKWAGIADDVVLGYDGRAVGFQFKTESNPDRFRLESLLCGANGLLAPLASSFEKLLAVHTRETVEVALVTNEFPSLNDVLPHVDVANLPNGAHSEAFVAEWKGHPRRSLSDWRATPWGGFVDHLQVRSRLDRTQFEQFFQSFKLLCGDEANFAQLHQLPPAARRQAAEIAKEMPRLVASSDKDRWTRAELLDELGWPDTAHTQLLHHFPVGPYVQPNPRTELELVSALDNATSGYIALVGPPGSGKSTLLQTALGVTASIRVVRYLAYVPGQAQQLGRGEAEMFLGDVATELRNSGLSGLRFFSRTLLERREQFGELLKKAGDRYAETGVRTIVVVDGLDHIPREEHPDRSLLTELPAPQSIPDGVLFVLGTQRLELDHLVGSVRDQAAQPGRTIVVAPLPRPAIERMAARLGLPAGVSRDRLYNICQGHPLVSRYLIRALVEADDTRRSELLAGGFQFDGDLESVYSSAWRALDRDPRPRNVLDLLAGAEGPMPLELIADDLGLDVVEAALLATRHLLVDHGSGWSIFHNSFRLYVLSRKKIVLGRPLPDHVARIYRKLAGLATVAKAPSPQRWMQLRYLAKAGDSPAALALTTAARFRAQMHEGRSDSDIYDDARLALIAAKACRDVTGMVRVLLARDEISRRAQAISESEEVLAALLATGMVDVAESFAADYPRRAYEVVDSLVRRGELERAERLFDRLDPQVQVISGSLEYSSAHDRYQEFTEWAARVVHFRDAERIERSIQALLPHLIEQLDEHSRAPDYANALRKQVLLSLSRIFPKANLTDLIAQYNGDPDWLVELLVSAGLQNWELNDRNDALSCFAKAQALPQFEHLSVGSKRRIAWRLAQAGEVAGAESVFNALVAPSWTEFTDTHRGDAAVSLVHKTTSLYALAAFLGKPPPSMAPADHTVIKPVQTFAAITGTLLGRLEAAKSNGRATGYADGELLQTTRNFLEFVLRARSNGSSDHFPIYRAREACPVIARTLLDAASRCTPAERDGVISALDQTLRGSQLPGATSTALYREVAAGVFEATGDAQRALPFLERLRSVRPESTPAAQLDELSLRAIALTNIGEIEKARELLSSALQDTLGTAVPAKKDAAYSMWMEVFERANHADPAQRGERVEVLLHQTCGMTQTEGDSAASRMAPLIVQEAAQDNPRLGMWAGKALLKAGAIEWPQLIDSLLIGTIRRRPDLAEVCAVIWSGLAMPYLQVPYFRSADQVGQLPSEALNAAGAARAPSLLSLLLPWVESRAMRKSRVAMLRRIRTTYQSLGLSQPELDAAYARWHSEVGEPEDRSTPQKYDEVQSLDELLEEARKSASEDADGYWVAHAFDRLAWKSTYQQARVFHDARPAVAAHPRSRFILIDMAMDAGDREFARSLLDGFEASPDDRYSWTSMLEGSLQRYFAAKVRLDGPTAHGPALDSFVESLLAGRENYRMLAAEIEALLPILAENPDWAVVWSLVAEPLSTTREFCLAPMRHLQADDESAVVDEEALLVALLRWALELPLMQVGRSARLSILQLTRLEAGRTVMARLVGQLAEGDADEALQAVRLVLHDRTGALRSEVQDRLSKLVGHDDFAVACIAEQILQSWGVVHQRPTRDLPLFYSIVLPNEVDVPEDAFFVDRSTGAMTIESSAGWTRHMNDIVEALAGPDVSPQHVRERCRMYISQWAGPRGALEAFGRAANQQREADLGNLGMRLPYVRTHMEIALRALRVGAGEIYQAGRLNRTQSRQLMRLFQFNALDLAPSPARPRPQWVKFPRRLSSYPGDEELRAWLDGVQTDVHPPIQIADEWLLALSTEVTIYVRNRATLSVEHLIAPFLEKVPSNALLAAIPPALWAQGVFPVLQGPSPHIVCRLSTGLMDDADDDLLVICPFWARRLGWQLDPQDPSLHRDKEGRVVVRRIAWRDGGAVDVYSDNTSADGQVLLVSQAGKIQLQAILDRDLLLGSHGLHSRQLTDGSPLSQSDAHAVLTVT